MLLGGLDGLRHGHTVWLEDVNRTSFLELGIYGNMIWPNDEVGTHRA